MLFKMCVCPYHKTVGFAEARAVFWSLWVLAPGPAEAPVIVLREGDVWSHVLKAQGSRRRATPRAPLPLRAFPGGAQCHVLDQPSRQAAGQEQEALPILTSLLEEGTALRS